MKLRRRKAEIARLQRELAKANALATQLAGLLGEALAHGTAIQSLRDRIAPEPKDD